MSKTYAVVLNPASGSGKTEEIFASIRPELEANDLDMTIIKTEGVGHATEIGQSLNIDDFDGVVTVGGDGTMHEVINGILTREDGKTIPVGSIPGGSGNSFLYGFGILTPEDGVKNLLAENRRKIDLAKIKIDDDILYSFNIIGWGLVVDIQIRSEKFRWWPQQRYNFATLIELIKLRARHTQLLVDGESLESDVSFMIACNTPYTGVGMKMAPNADLQDGKIDLVIVKEASRLQMMNLFPKVFDGSHIESDLVDYRQVSNFSLLPSEEDFINVDGELKSHTPIEVSMVPQGIEVMV